MSCQLVPFSCLQDVRSLREYLFPSLRDAVPQSDITVKKQEDENVTAADGWDEDWDNWNEDGAEEEEEIEDQSDGSQADYHDNNYHKWLQGCLLALSPANDLLALANEDRIVVLSPKFDPDAEFETTYAISWQGNLKQEDGEVITAVMCLPLASQKRSTQGGPDWTCLVVGFSSGYIRMYTETGTLLLSQKLHTEPVQKLKSNTYEPPRYLGISEQHEELVILFKKVIVTIDGFSLFQALKACRNQVARATASGETTLQAPPLAYKKWGIQEQEETKDFHSCGVHTPNPFDQMVSTSSQGGPGASIRPTSPAASEYIVTGVAPCVGFYFAVEGSAQPILSDVAYAVASKLKSAIMSAASGWLGFGARGRTEDERHKPKIEPATPLPLRFGLSDQRRQGSSISMAQNGKFAAVTDSFGRVLLIDVDRGIAVRMWKGYRDAQVGWIHVKEEEGTHTHRTGHGRVAQFLVIYAARRGILEVWMTGNGPRVAAFNVSKWCQLICPSHGILGLNNVTCKGVKTKVFQCALLDIDGVVKTVEVPFHLALSDKNNKRVRDMHLLKKLKLALKENSMESDGLEAQVKDLLLNIKIANIAQQGLERVLETRYLSSKFQGSILKACIEKLSDLGEDKLDIDRKLFLRFCKLKGQLLNTYIALDRLNSMAGAVGEEECNTETLGRLLGLTDAELEQLMSQTDQWQHIHQRSKVESHVKFKTDVISNSAMFLSCFECQPHISDGDSGQPGASAILLVKNLCDDRKLELGSFIFDGCLKCQCSSVDVGEELTKSHIPLEEIGDLLLYYWLSEDDRPLKAVPILHSLLKIISSNLGKSSVIVDSNNISPWWQSVRDTCSQSSHNKSAYLAALVAKAVAVELSGASIRINNSKDPDADMDTISHTSEKTDESLSLNEWEPIALDMERWNLLVKQLEDLFSLCCLLKLYPDSEKRQYREESPGGSSQREPVTVSVSRLLEGGKGCVSEVVARHVARARLCPEDLYRPRTEENEDHDASLKRQDSQPAEKETSVKSTKELIWDQMACLRKRFPHSLENDVLFCNCCWEYSVQWNKEPEDVENFRLALDFLKLVQNAVLRHGVACMMWHMFLVKRFQATAQLMEKVGKVPKDRLCRKDVGISEGNLPQFVSCISDFLDTFMEANCEINEVPVFNLEPLWNHGKVGVSLVELAIDQKGTNYGLLKHHRHLAIIMNAVLTFNMKSVKVISLFDSKGKNSFFVELHSHPLLPNQNIDSVICGYRRVLLTRVITQVVLTMKSQADQEPKSPTVLTHRLRTGALAKWPPLLVNLAHDFGLDIDLVKRHHVCELYSAGFDKIAEEVLLTVNDHDIIGSQLLKLGGQRITQYISVSRTPKVVEIMSNVNPSLSTWLKSLDPTVLYTPSVQLCDTSMLISHSVTHLREGSSEYELAIALVDLVQSLQ